MSEFIHTCDVKLPFRFVKAIGVVNQPLFGGGLSSRADTGGKSYNVVVKVFITMLT